MSEITANYFKLIKAISIQDDDKKIKFKRNFTNKLWPFFSRNPERYLMKDNFDGPLGMIVRSSRGKTVFIKENQINLDLIKAKISYDGLADSELKTIFNLDNVRTSQVEYLQYLTNASTAEKKGQAEVAEFLIKLLKLEDNTTWQDLFEAHTGNDLFTQVIMELLPNLDDENNKPRNFAFFNQAKYANLFAKDIQVLAQSNNRTFIVKNIGLLLAYFYVFYLIYEIPQAFKLTTDAKQSKMYFNYEKEATSQSRPAIRSYAEIKNTITYLLYDNDLLDYLNLLLGHDKKNYQNLPQIMSNDEATKANLLTELRKFNVKYADSQDKELNKYVCRTTDDDLKAEITQLRSWLRKDIHAEEQSRYRKGFEEIKNMGFIKSRGRLGAVLNVRKDLLLALTAVIVGNQDKMLLHEVFVGFEEHGMYFDNLTKKAITEFYVEVNILDKMSDSGDAQYVKQIL